MLQFFHDQALTVGNNSTNPKRFLCPLSGQTGKSSVVYLADIYVASVVVASAANDTILRVNQTDEFLPSGTAYIVSGSNQYTITYTSKTSGTLQGVSGLTAPLNIGDTVKPWKIYKTTGNFVVAPSGADLNNVLVGLGSSPTDTGYPGSIFILSTNTFDNVLTGSIPIYMSVGCLAGDQADFTNWNIQINPIFVRDKNDTSSIGASEIGYTVNLYGDLFRRNQFQNLSLRLLPVSQKILNTSPGFTIGSYRWRDQTSVNSQTLTSTIWNIDVNNIGIQNFLSGIGDGDDLLPVDIENVGNSIYLRIKNGFYFVGPTQYFLPANPQFKLISAGQTSVVLDPPPAVGTPIFVGVWQQDVNLFYSIQIKAAYQPLGSFDTSTGASIYQYTVNRKTNVLDINFSLGQQTISLGMLSGQQNDFFNLSVYPIDSIQAVYVDRGLGNPKLFTTNFVFDQSEGTIALTANSSTQATSISGALVGEVVYADINPAYAIVYDTESYGSTRLLDTTDLNPAFSGISSGFVYIQHRKQEPFSLSLAADKPIIVIPATQATIINLVAYGPVYLNGDYSLLTVTAYGPLGSEVIPNAEIQLIPGAKFSGTINYKDPTIEAVTGITGADGKVNFLYLPDLNYGIYIPSAPATGGSSGLATTNTPNDSILLPEPIPIDEIYNTIEGWLVSLYNVLNTDPVLGMIGADTSKGQLPFLTTGVIGSESYKTNGEKVLWANGAVGIQPLTAVDSLGNAYTSSNFNGLVSKIVYPSALITTPNIGAYFINYVQRVSVQARYVNSDVFSNTIILEMAMPNSANNTPWLTLNSSTQGILNQYRLGWQQDLPESI